MALFLALGCGAAQAQLLVDPGQPAGAGEWQVGGAAQHFNTPYEVDTRYPKLRHPTFGRNIYSLYGAYGLMPRADVFVAAGLTDDADNSDHPAIVGHGYEVALGARGLLAEYKGCGLIGWGQFMHLEEDYTTETVRKEVRGHFGYEAERAVTWNELTLGLLIRYACQRFALYAGPEVLAYKQDHYDYTETFLDDRTTMESDTLDVTRNASLGFRIGGRVNFGTFFAFANAAFGYEESGTAGLGADF